MAGLKSAWATRTGSNDYTDLQRIVIGRWLFDIWDAAGFSGLYEGEARRFMPRLLFGVCIASMRDKPLSITDAFIIMDTKHGKTAAKYIELAESQGLLNRTRDPNGDARKTLLVPTELLVRKFREEVARVADDFREMFAALLWEQDALPESGAPEFRMLKRSRNEPNRHLARAEADTPFPNRHWTGTYLSPK